MSEDYGPSSTKSTLYHVTFRVRREGWPTSIRESRVRIYDGYSTEADIPKIVSLPLGLRVEDVEIICALTDAEVEGIISRIGDSK